jgi:hypothetical protein
MNILEQEDMVKGLPDQILIQQAQMPTGEIPQFLVVSELDRRQKMRKSFAERVPEETVTDQVISQGIAAMNPNPDPLMATAMGAQPPQDPMMSQQMPPQDPMMQPPMDQQMMPSQDPMMMAAGGGMMPYRMFDGGGTPYAPGSAESVILERLIASGMSKEEALRSLQYTPPTGLTEDELLTNIYEYTPSIRDALSATSPDSIGDYTSVGIESRADAMKRYLGGDVPSWASGRRFLPRGRGARSKFMEFAEGRLDPSLFVEEFDANDPALQASLGSPNVIEDVTAGIDLENLKPREKSSWEKSFDLLPKSVKQDTQKIRKEDLLDPDLINLGLSGASGVPKLNNYVETVEAQLGGNKSQSPTNALTELQQFKNIYQGRDIAGIKAPDYTGLATDFAGLLDAEKIRSEKAAKEIREDAINNAIIQMGAGIASGDLSKGLSDAGTAAMAGRKEARSEEKGLTDLKRQMKLMEAQEKSALGIKQAEATAETERFRLTTAISEDRNTYEAFKALEALEIQRQNANTAQEKQALDARIGDARIALYEAQAEWYEGGGSAKNPILLAQDYLKSITSLTERRKLIAKYGGEQAALNAIAEQIASGEIDPVLPRGPSATGGGSGHRILSVKE